MSIVTLFITCKKLEVAQVSINKRMNFFKKIMACSYIKIPLSNKKQCANGSHDNMGECQKHPERKKRGTKESIVYDSKCMHF